MKEKREITDCHPYEDAIEATHQTQRMINNRHSEAKSSSSTTTTADMTASAITNPIVPIGQFFHDEPSLSWQPLPAHSLDQSSCYVIIGVDKK